MERDGPAQHAVLTCTYSGPRVGHQHSQHVGGSPRTSTVCACGQPSEGIQHQEGTRRVHPRCSVSTADGTALSLTTVKARWHPHVGRKNSRRSSPVRNRLQHRRGPRSKPEQRYPHAEPCLMPSVSRDAEMRGRKGAFVNKKREQQSPCLGRRRRPRTHTSTNGTGTAQHGEG